MKGIYWKRLLRRALAVFLATIALWLLGLGLTVGAHSGALQTLGSDESFDIHALQAELGTRELAARPRPRPPPSRRGLSFPPPPTPPRPPPRRPPSRPVGSGHV